MPRSRSGSVASLRSVTSTASVANGAHTTYFAKVWLKPPHELFMTDKGKHGIKITCGNESPQLTSWWISTLKASYPQDSCSDDGRFFRMRPEHGVFLKLDKKHGLLKIKGNDHYQWFLENIEEVLQAGGIEVTLMADLFNQIGRQLGIDGISATSLLENLPDTGAIQNGAGSIYSLWKTLLDRWMGFGGTITVASPVLDPERFMDLILLMIKNDREGFTLKLVTSERCDGEHSLKHTKMVARDLLKKLKTTGKRRRLVTDEKIDWAYKHIETKTTIFNCRFIGMSTPHKAEVMITSAGFIRRYFHNDLKDSISFFRLTPSEYRTNYIDPLGIEQKTSF
ncbi:uncharacterized protein LOC106157812 [Lingula anatina]|uniref:Uncharacterized protein LOC106157812 n=1 Tax=Lingula anatina TaxID=7574 RepID=A0A1S3HSL7_LINAN|nr:uncharacterized protein LOC106157812 [Lingula anatina]|eukprot:XP_013389018.1 uncharacterized protein LOC106157812 [Lingula anatina]